MMMTAFQLGLIAQIPPVLNDANEHIRSSKLTHKYLTPVRVVHVFEEDESKVNNPESILNPGLGQADLNQGEYLTLVSDDDSQPGIILDFGKEIQGGIEIVTSMNNANPAGRVRLRFGESVAETMSEVTEDGATNDHAMRDFEVTLPWLGRLDVGQTGFRFVRIDLVEPNAQLEIKEASVMIFK